MFRLGKIRHKRHRIVSATIVTLACLFASAGNAWGISAPIQVAGTDGEGIFIRPEPNTSQSPLGWMAEGASPEYICFTHGEMVGNVNVWFNVTYNGVTGYYASFYDNSSYKNDAELTAKYGVPACTAAPPIPQAPISGSGSGSSSVPTPAPSGASFNRRAAAAWAEAHARQTPPEAAACTWFVSQALWAGGLAQDSAWASSGSHGVIPVLTKRQGTIDAWAVPNFVSYIRTKYPNSTFTKLNFRVNSVPAAQQGDVIIYAENGGAVVGSASTLDGALDHAALVVGDARDTQYPEVAEWGANDHGPIGGAVNYTKRGWTWSDVSQEWLQVKYRKIQAFLLHIVTN
jgi:Putative amidase domain